MGRDNNDIRDETQLGSTNNVVVVGGNSSDQQQQEVTSSKDGREERRRLEYLTSKLLNPNRVLRLELERLSLNNNTPCESYRLQPRSPHPPNTHTTMNANKKCEGDEQRRRQEEEAEEPTPGGTLEQADAVSSGQVVRRGEAFAVEAEPSTTTSKQLSTEEKSRAKRFAYLLKQSEIFSHFAKSSEGVKGRRKVNEALHDRAGSGESEDEDDEETTTSHVFTSSPTFIKNGEMRDYQVQGLNWLISLYQNGINGILADEMGLGKTIQTISLLGYLRTHLSIAGPHLIIAPLSTISNWMNEFAKWYPPHRAICITGTKEERADFMDSVFRQMKWDVCIVSYQLVTIELKSLKRVKWAYVVIDEAQRIKNENSLLSKNVRLLKSTNRLLLTGTPLQNNLHELWALLNFLLPDLFDSADDFDTWFDTNHCLGDETAVSRLHGILNPFLLRRVKADVEKSLLPKRELKVYVELSQMQLEMYRKVLLGELEVLSVAGTFTKSRLLNMLMQLRKVCNHPYLFPGAEPRFEGRFITDVHMLTNCGKLSVLDKLLSKLKVEGSRILLFSQFTSLLDILEDYCWWRRYKYCRLDGSTNQQDRQDSIDEFNARRSDVFLFLLSTRAGGLGINLASADVVILYDSDWNPQMDLQAMDRCHRIGQKKQVRVFRLITAGTIEEKIVEKADIKMHLDRIVIQEGRLVDGDTKGPKGKDLLGMIRFGAEKILAAKDLDNNISDESIEAILARSWAKSRDMEIRLGTMEESSLREFEMDVPQGPLQLKSYVVSDFEGKDYRKLRTIKQKEGGFDRLPPRARNYYNLATKSPSIPRPSVAQATQEQPHLVDLDLMLKKKPKVIYDFQFCSPRLVEFYYQELDYFDQLTDFEYKPISHHDPVLDEWDKGRQRERGVPLTEQEISEKAELLSEGFMTWSDRHARDYYKALKERTCFDDDIPTVPSDFTERLKSTFLPYHVTFLQRHHELLNFHSIFKKYKLQPLLPAAIARWTQAFNWKVAQYENPVEELKIRYVPREWLGKRFKAKLDRQLVMLGHQVGFEEKPFPKMIQIIEENSCGEYGKFMRTRSMEEIHSRCVLLLHLIEKEMEAARSQGPPLVPSVVPIELSQPVTESEEKKENDMTPIVDLPPPAAATAGNKEDYKVTSTAIKRKSPLSPRPRLTPKVFKAVFE